MRFVMLAVAFGAASLAMPAQAAPHNYSIAISGWVNGLQTAYDPNAQFCNGGAPNTPQCTAIVPFFQEVGATINIFGETPTGPFDFGNSRSIGGFSGTIQGSVAFGLTGVNLTYLRDSAGCCFFQQGTAPTFSARLLTIDGVAAPAPAPEPATWAMMIVGFGAMAAAMRRRRQAKVIFA